jgi:hypothetical protein
LGFDVEITTGKEVNPEGADVSRFILQARDNGAGDDFQDSTVFAKRLSWSYGILTPDGRAFEPTSATFVDGSGFRRNGEVGSRFNATDVMAMQFKAVWSVVGAAATRTLTCTVRLDKFRYYPKYVLQPSS